MTKWLKKFLTRDTDLQEGDIILTPVIDVTKPDIGEPVLSFVQCVKENPKRFIFTRINTCCATFGRSTYRVFDKNTGEQWCVKLDWRTNRNLICKELEWLTDDESIYLVKEILNFYIYRKQKLREIRNIRFERTQITERKRLMGVYCK